MSNLSVLIVEMHVDNIICATCSFPAQILSVSSICPVGSEKDICQLLER